MSIIRFIFIGLLLFAIPTLHAQNVTLNFKDTDIQQLVNIVSEVTQKTFIVDPRVKAKVNVISTHPMDEKQVYAVFLSILNVHGFTAIESDNHIVKIVPDNLAKSQNTPVLSERQAVKGDSLVTKIIRVQHVSAAQLVPLLRPLIPQHGHIVAYPSNNSLIISDYAGNVKRLQKVIQRIDQPSDEGVEVIMLQHASAPEVSRILTTLYQRQAANKTTTGTTAPSVIADERTNSILISGDKATRLHLRTIVTHLDTPLKSVGNTKVIYLRYAQATNLVEVLKGVSDTIEEQKQGETGTTSNSGTRTSIQADETTNSLVITAAPDVLRNLENVINKLDIRRAQVLVEAVIAEVSVDRARELGVQWITYNSGDNLTPIGMINFDNAGVGIADLAASAYRFDQGNSNIAIPDGVNGALFGLGHLGGAFNFALLVKALAADTNSNVLSTPSLLTLDNQEAEIVVGQNVPFLTGQYTNTGAVSGATNPFQTIQREDIGIKLKVKPQINEGDAVKLNIEQEVSSLTRSSVATADIVTNKRTIKTTVIVEDGNMVVLGGLTSEDLQQVSQKVPILGDIPLLGALFRSKDTQKIKRNLMIFLHPIIIRDAETERLISQQKYEEMQQIQQQQREKGLSLLPDDEVPVLPSLNDFIAILPNNDELSMPSQPQGY
ncbi:type II secretion system secretin GspD [Candidatus Albibeggiatoa sp. nov. NOAA]|uniref:type II secretion system secretin GspD n=1 Tax=Candidatus Albibeggiatoa sp. nov. NOAA TaxID=3162724 RepID=UPI0032F5AE77|nr:type II secretion system secretin GspD [Thiotrichaceae bacterium]